MKQLTKLEGYVCEICGHDEFLPVDFSSYTMRTTSSNPDLNDYVNHICDNCGVVTPYPQANLEKLIEHYNSAYRKDAYTLDLNGKLVNPPVQIPWSGVSFLRFQSFFDMVERNKSRLETLEPTQESVFIDYGAYQGMFLSGVKEAWNSTGIAYDFNEKGIEFAKNVFGFENSVVAKDIYGDKFAQKANYVTLVHVFEHLQYPRKFLQHLRDEVLVKNGWLYIEVPNAFGFPLSDPTHYYAYTQASLKRVLRDAGFTVRDSWIGNYPLLEDHAEWSTPIQSIYCLAQLSDGDEVVTHERVYAADIYKEMKQSYRILSRNYVLGRLKLLFRDTLRMGKHALEFLKYDYLGKK